MRIVRNEMQIVLNGLYRCQAGESEANKSNDCSGTVSNFGLLFLWNNCAKRPSKCVVLNQEKLKVYSYVSEN